VARRPRSVTITLGMILLGAVIWLVFGILLALNAHPAFPDDVTARSGMAVLSVAAACAILVLLYLLRRRRPLAYFVMLGILAAASLAVFLDDVGLVDLVFLGITLIPLGLLLRDRAWYTSA